MKIHFYKILLLAIICIFSSSVYAQRDSLKIDSLKKVLLTEKEDTNKVKILNMLGGYYWYTSENTNSLNMYFMALSLSEKTRFIIGKAAALFGIARIYHFQGNYPQAIQYYYIALRLYEQMKSKVDMQECLNAIGQSNVSQANYTEALKNDKEALKVSLELKDTDNITHSFNTIANVYLLMGDNTEALKNFNASLQIRKAGGSKWQICQSYINIGNVYLNEKNYRQALMSDSLALKIALDISDKRFFWTVAMCNGSIGEIYEKEGDFNDSIGNKVTAQQMYLQTLKSYLTTLDIWQKNGRNSYTVAGVRADVGAIYIKLKQFKKARFYLEKAFVVIINSGDKSQIEPIYHTLSTLDSAEGNYKKGYEDYKMYIIYRDSIYNEDNTRKNLQSNMQYEFDKKEAVTKADQDKKDADTKRVKKQQYFAITALGVIIFAVLAIALIQFRNNKQKQKINLLITQQKEKVEATLSELKSTQSLLIQSEKMASLGELTAGIAHEIQNPLNFVNNFSEVSTELMDEMNEELDKGDINEAKSIAADIKQNLEKINHHGKRADAIVKGMLQHSRTNTGAKEPTNINNLADEYLRLAYHGIRAKDKSFNALLKTDFDESIGKINIISQDIGRVILNLITNAFYAVAERKKQIGEGYEPAVSVRTKKIRDKIEICVKDNGNGIPQKVLDKIFQPFFTTKPTGQGTGLGLSLSYDIIKAHGGQIIVESTEGEGTVFIIQLPIA